MAAISARVREKMAQDILQIIVFLHVIHQFGHCQPTVETSGQAFVQTDKELRYMVDGIHLQIPGKNIEDIRWDDTSTNPVLFEPPLLDFEEQPVGMPHLEKVTVQNTDSKNSLHLLSISGSTSHFHCSFFQEKHVPPGGNTTFEVVFLARRVGNVENTLYIHTSVGTFKYQVFGVGITNPYRVRPLLGAKVAVNTSFSPLIHLHNPHSTPLQVEEVYSSGGDLHLTLPTGELEATQQLWEIPPYDTKPIMKANFLGRYENNHTAFIRIKTNKDDTGNILVLPVEVEVNTDPGIFSTFDKLDFGIVRSCDPPKQLELTLYSSRVYPIPIHDVYVSPPNDAIQIDFQPTYLKADLWEPTTIARISFNASRAKHIKQTSGIIIVRSKTESHRHVIPYQATVLHGSIFYDRNKTTFYTGQANRTISRNLPITNMFNVSIAIHNVSVSPDKAAYFSIDKFKEPIVIVKGDTKVPILLHFYMNETNLHFNTNLILHTNASTFYLPIRVYNGKLKAVHHRPELFRGQLDFGTLNMGSEYSMLITLRNENPVNLILRQYASNIDKSHVELLGVEAGNGTMLTRYHDTSVIPSPLHLPPNHFAVFNVSIVTRDSVGAFAGECIFYTQFENLYVPITLRTADGSLNMHPKSLVFDRCFPGKLCQQEVSMNSTFGRYLSLRDIIFQPNDTRFYYTPSHSKDILIGPYLQTDIGSIAFDPKRGSSGCHDDCYLGLPTYIPAGRKWLEGTALEVDTPDVDLQLYTRATDTWAQIRQQQHDVLNMTMKVDADQMRGWLFSAQAHLTWPSVVQAQRIHFPLTQIGNSSVHDLVLENPSDVPVIVQVLPLVLYPSPETILNIVGSSIPDDLNSILDSTNSFAFSMHDLRSYSPQFNFTKRHRRKLEKIHNIKTHPESLVLTLNASSSVTVNVGFTPKDDLLKTSLLLIRNNLTILETVVLQGRGGRGDMRFGNKKIGSTLVFEVTDKNCDRKKSSKSSPNFTVKNKFTAKNTGQLPFYIKSFSVNDRECEGYGFKVLECEGFELPPNASRTVNIAFTPDFSMSRIQRVLTLHTSLGPAINYTLQASVPPHLLTKCSAALPRPTWEPLLYYSIVCIMGFFLFCIFAASYFEAERIYTAERIRARLRANALLESQSGSPIDRSKVFDLNNLANEKVVANGGGPHHRLSNGSVGGASRNSAEHAHTTAEQRYVETLVPSSTPRPSSARKRKETHSPSIVSYIYKAFGYLKFSFKFNLFKPTVKSSGSPHHGSGSGSGPGAKSEKESKSNSAKNSDSTKADTTHSQVTATQTTILRRNSSTERDIIEENSAPRSNSRSKNKATAIKPQFPDLIEDVVRSSENKSAKNKGIHNHDVFSNNNKNKASDRKRNDRYSSGGGIEPVDLRSNNSTPEIDEDDQTFNKGKRARRLRRGEMLFPTEKRQSVETDETSSTTTESSIEVEDKSSTHDSTPEPHPPKLKRKKGKKKTSEVDTHTRPDELQEDEYIIGSRSKVHKKVHGDFGGNILQPSSLELPYKLEGDSSPKPSKNHDHASHSTVGRRAAKNRNKKKSQHTHLSLDGHRTPPPLWDQPKPIALNDDLSEISLQTQLFAQRVRSGGAGGVLNDQLTNSSRSSSYSSVVSSGSDKLSAKDKNSAFSPVNVDARAPGTVLGKPISPDSAAKKPAWLASASGFPQDSQLSPGNNFGLEPITESSSSLGSHSFTAPLLSQPTSGADSMNFAAAAPAMTGGNPQQQFTIMQQLLAERRQRQMEYEQKRMSGDNWPFFDSVLPTENVLWNMTSPAPGAEWAAPGSGAPGTSPPSSNAIWRPTTTASSAASWGAMGTTSSIWSNAGSSPGVGEAGLQGAFDPFNNLWNPGAGFGGAGVGTNGTGQNTWGSFTPPPPKPDEN